MSPSAFTFSIGSALSKKSSGLDQIVSSLILKIGQNVGITENQVYLDTKKILWICTFLCDNKSFFHYVSLYVQSHSSTIFSLPNF